ncbi:MAG: ATP-dependent RNA helicase DbpA [Tatlockia sp.]|nr:ATP-dependent RNA helicase DbpA [Tatlockia sp.]
MNSAVSDLPNTVSEHFSTLNLRAELLTNLLTLGYVNMTLIQAQSLPLMLNGNDLIAQAKTGSGKTAAFGLALLNQLRVEDFSLQALILCPTRELAEQVARALRQLARSLANVKILNLSGGMPMKPQQDSLKHGAHVVVGTPGRIQKHLDKNSLSLNKLQSLILDEADRMLDMGFLESMKKIIALCPKKRQTLLFSATFPKEIQGLAKEFMQDAKRVVVEEKHTESEIEQLFYEVSKQSNKFPILKTLLLHYKPTSTLIFCNTKEQTLQLANLLVKEGFSAIALNGDMEQVERDLAMIRFINQSCSILVATDVAARGLDIKELPAVINFDLAFEEDVHTHRVGRTGRAGNKGLALSLTTAGDAERLCLIETNLARPLNWGTIADLESSTTIIAPPKMVTLCLFAGRKDKIRNGDILGALTKEAGLEAKAIGKIDITASYSYVAIDKEQVKKAYQALKNGKLKGRKINLKMVG